MMRSVSGTLFLIALGACAATNADATPTTGVGDGAGGFYVSQLRSQNPFYLGTTAVTAPVSPVESRVFRVTGSGGIAAGWPTDGVSPATGPARAESAILVTDGAGGVIAVWSDGLNLGTRVFAQRLDPTGARLWGVGGVLVSSGAGYRSLESAIADGAGGVLVGWQESGNDPEDLESDLWAQRLTPTGAVASGWPAGGVALCAATGQQRSLRLATDGAGGLVACWFDGRGFNPATYLQRVNGSGVAQWDADGLSAGISPPADIAADGASGAFLTSVSGGYVVAQRVNSSGSAGWTPGGVAISDIGFLVDPRVIADGAGGAVIHWCEQPLTFPMPMPVLKAMRLTSTGAASAGWPSNGLYVGDSLSFGSQHHAMRDGTGGFLFAWTDWRVGSVVLGSGDTLRGNLIRPRAKRISGAGALSPGWPGGGVRVSLDSAQVIGQDIAFVGDGAGGAMFGWQDVRSGYFGQRLAGSGAKQWNLADVRLVAEAGGQSTPAIGSDGGSGALVGWMEFAAGSSGVFARRIDAAGALATAKTPLGPPRGYLSTLVAPDGLGGNFLLSGSYYSNYRVQRFAASGAALWDTAAVIGQFSGVAFLLGLVGDGAGGVYVFWSDQAYIPTLQRIDANGHAAGPAAQPFGADPYVFVIPGATLVADGEGGVVLVQPKPVDTGLGQRTHVWVQRVDSSGVALWGVTGIGVLGGERDYEYVRAAGDGAGGALLTWTGDAFYTSADVWALRVDDTGSAASGWSPAGVLVCGAPGRQLYPDVAADGAGGCLIGWTDARGEIPQVYAQALSAGGVAQWAADGIPLGPGSGAQYLQQLVPDGAAGAIASWMDARGAAWGLRAQRVSGASSLLWGAGGLDVGAGGAAPSLSTYGTPSAAGNQSAPVMAPDGLGGAVMAWQEAATPFEFVVRAQRINGDGTLAWPGGVTGTLASLVSAHASPGLVRLEWWSASTQVATVRRARSAAEWIALAPIAPTNEGRYVFEDHDVVPGQRYGYRLVFAGTSGDRIADETWLDVPAAHELGFSGAFPNPVTDDVTMAFTLRGGVPAWLDVFDVAGRRVITRDLGKLGAGSHRLLVARPGALGPGVYLARITEGGAVRTRRFVVAR